MLSGNGINQRVHKFLIYMVPLQVLRSMLVCKHTFANMLCRHSDARTHLIPVSLL